MKKNKKNPEVKYEKSLEVIVKELFTTMEAETAGALENYKKRKRNSSLSFGEIMRYFEYWRGLSRMEAIVRKFIESKFNGMK